MWLGALQRRARAMLLLMITVAVSGDCYVCHVEKKKRKKKQKANNSDGMVMSTEGSVETTSQHNNHLPFAFSMARLSSEQAVALRE